MIITIDENEYRDCLLVVFHDDFERRTYLLSTTDPEKIVSDGLFKNDVAVENEMKKLGTIVKITENVEFVGEGNFSGANR